MVAPLIEHHVLDYPGGYTRSVGTAVSRTLTGLRAGKIIGVLIGDGRVMVPPTGHDPETGGAPDEYVEFGPAATGVSRTIGRPPGATRPQAGACRVRGGEGTGGSPTGANPAGP